MYQRKRKDVDVLDKLADSESNDGGSAHKRRRFQEGRFSGDPFLASRYPTASLEHLHPGQSHRRSLAPQSPYSMEQPCVSAASGSSERQTVTNTKRVMASRTFAATSVSTSNPSPMSLGRSAKVNTPFKPPGTVGTIATPNGVVTPSSIPRRFLGTTRPSSKLAHDSLQLDWSKFSEANKAVNQPATLRSSVSTFTKKAVLESDVQREARRLATFEQLQQQASQAIVPVNAKRRDGEQGDTSNWMFDD